MATPLLSVVIPTYKRPHFLKRAIDSALNSSPNNDIEIIVVPNGSDNSWKQIAHSYKDEARVKWRTIADANACKARNKGLETATGKYIRFLDDDDYLYPAASMQLSLLENDGLEFCSGETDKISPDNRIKETTKLSFESDLISAALASDGFTLPIGNVYSLKKARSQKWREHITLYDDYYWILDLVINEEWKWAHVGVPVGAYVQHFAPRLSFEKRTARNSMERTEFIFSSAEFLNSKNQLTGVRKKAISTAILTHAYSTFTAAPLDLTAAIRTAEKLCSEATPNQAIFRRHPFLAKNFLLFQWISLPIRILSKKLRIYYWSINQKMASVKKPAAINTTDI